MMSYTALDQVSSTLLAAAKPGRPLVLNFGSCS